MLVEVNKDNEGSPLKTQTATRVIRHSSGSAKVTENYDEIITVKRDDNTEEIADNQCKEKGFSIQRAWCCLMNRRTS